MSVDDLLAGDAVLVDANIFTYHFQPHPTWGASCTVYAPPCREDFDKVRIIGQGFDRKLVADEILTKVI